MGTAELLLQHGADTTLQDGRGRTVAQILEAKRRPDLRAWLEGVAQGSTPETSDAANKLYITPERGLDFLSSVSTQSSLHVPHVESHVGKERHPLLDWLLLCQVCWGAVSC